MGILSTELLGYSFGDSKVRSLGMEIPSCAPRPCVQR